jgi:hypothetical protein
VSRLAAATGVVSGGVPAAPRRHGSSWVSAVVLLVLLAALGAPLGTTAAGPDLAPIATHEVHRAGERLGRVGESRQVVGGEGAGSERRSPDRRGGAGLCRRLPPARAPTC